MPSILKPTENARDLSLFSFKPCYKWNAFNTKKLMSSSDKDVAVLNLVISGMPSIL